MAWAGRVLLIVLIASTLFVANQNDFQTETAIAQQNSGPIKILTNDLTFSVVGSGIATATQAKINHQTEAVYVNGIKIQNTTAGYPNFDLQVFFDLTFYISNNNPNSSDSFDIPLVGNNTYTGGPGICGDGSARLFRGSLLPYETRTIPTNLACADITHYGDRAQFTAGSIPDGQNSASLNIVLRPNDNVILPTNTLIWPAAKITVTDLFPTSGGTHYMSLRLPDNSTRPSLSGTLFYSGGTTQSFGAALLGPPGTIYKISHSVIPNNQNPAPLLNLTVDDYAMYEQTVSVTKPNVQLSASPVTITAGQSSTLTWASSNSQSLTIDKGIGNVTVPNGSRAVSPTQTTTYTITARAQSGATATATATIQVTNDLPDLVLDTSQMVVERKDINNPQIMNFGSTPVLIGDETEQLVAKNLRIKNIGQGTAKGTVSISGNGSFIYTSHNEPHTTLNLPPGSSVSLPDYTGRFSSLENNGVKRDWLYKDNLKKLALSGKNQLDIKISLNYFRNQGEPKQSNEANDELIINNFLRWPEIRVKVVSDSSLTPVVGAVVAFVSPGGTERTKSITDANGIAYKPIALSPRNGAKTYTITAYIGGKAQGSSQQAIISDYSLYDIDAVISNIIIIDIKLFIDIPDAKDFKPTNGGAITLNRVEGSPAESIGGNTSCSMTVPAKEGVALFDPVTFPCLTSGTYKLLPSSFVFKNLDNEVANFNWPEPSRSDQFDNFAYSTGDVVQKTVRTKLPYSCETNQVAKRPLEICYTDEQAMITQTKTIVSPIVTSVFSRLTSWVKYPPKDWNKVIIGYSSDEGAIAYYEYNRREQITGIDRWMLKSSDTENRNTIVHEIFHMLDNFYRPGGSYTWDFLTIKTPLYKQSINDQLDGNQAKGMTSATGSQLWDIVSYNGAYTLNNIGGYDARSLRNYLLRRGGGHLVEALAEELSTVCIYQQAVANRLNNINTVWRDKIGQNPPPDLAAHVTNVKNRMQGIFIDANNITTIVPEMASWYQQCLAN